MFFMSLEINANNVILNNDPSAKKLITYLENNQKNLGIEDGKLYYEFQFALDLDGTPQRFDVILITKFGILIFELKDISKRIKIEDFSFFDYQQNYSSLFSKLLKNSYLRSDPVHLNLKIYPIFYLHSDKEIERSNYDNLRKKWPQLIFIFDTNELIPFFKTIQSTIIDETVFRETISMLEGSKGIIPPRIRPKKNLDSQSKGRILDKIDNEIALFDSEQKAAALQIIDGPQRIRGLAGSGKTIVLTMKAAQIHASSPDSKILFTYWTKQLHDYIQLLITRFYHQLSEKNPNWDKIDIIHAWGGRNLRGVYYDACRINGVKPKSLKEVIVYRNKAFDVACEDLNHYDLKQTYDYSIIDEGQSFSKNFYRICRKITKNNRVIWAYDECQNIFDMEIQDVTRTFGHNEKGEPYVDLSKSPNQDIILYKCYRNPLSVLVTGFALGLGIYNDKILQMPESKELWKDWGFEIKKGDYKTGDDMVIIRPKNFSPLLKNKLLENGKTPVQWKIFNPSQKGEISYIEECEFVANQIARDIDQDLLPQDIMVITLDDFAAVKYFKGLNLKLAERKIDTFDATLIPYSSTQFFQNDKITLTTVYRAQGHEAGSVYIVGIDKIFQYKDSVIERNKLFTAITRSNAWITMTGSGIFSKIFEEEIKKIVQNNFTLAFKMPDLTKLRQIRRDLVERNAKIQELNKMIDLYSQELDISPDDIIKIIQDHQVKK